MALMRHYLHTHTMYVFPHEYQRYMQYEVYVRWGRCGADVCIDGDLHVRYYIYRQQSSTNRPDNKRMCSAALCIYIYVLTDIYGICYVPSRCAPQHTLWIDTRGTPLPPYHIYIQGTHLGGRSPPPLKFARYFRSFVFASMTKLQCWD